VCEHDRVTDGAAADDSYLGLERGSGGALKVSPHDAHRQKVSFVISFASVPTLVDLHEGHKGRFGAWVEVENGRSTQPPSLWRRL